MNANIRKYEEIGTHPAANHNAISVALTFHQAIGADRKVARLRYLRDRWAMPLHGRERPGEGADAAQLARQRRDRLRHHRRARPGQAAGAGCSTSTASSRRSIVHPQFSGLRITPNVYTTPAEIDTFTDPGA